ncbi:MAG: phosphatase [Actinomycetota bacterium]
MESLVIAVIIITSPAMYGGPLALALTFWRSHSMGPKRRFAVYLLSFLALLSGAFLIIQNISRGATIIGLIGLVTAITAVVRIRRTQ